VNPVSPWEPTDLYIDREDDHGEEVEGEEDREKEKACSGQEEENTESGQEGHEEKGDEGKKGRAEAQSAGETGLDARPGASTPPIHAATTRRHGRHQQRRRLKAAFA
jgi:hypothetical protein